MIAEWDAKKSAKGLEDERIEGVAQRELLLRTQDMADARWTPSLNGGALELNLICRAASRLGRSLQYRCCDFVLPRRRPPNRQRRRIDAFRVRENIHLDCLQKISAARAPGFDGCESGSKQFASMECGKPNRIGPDNQRAITISAMYIIVYYENSDYLLVFAGIIPCLQGIIPPRFYFSFAFANGQGLLHRSGYHAISLVV